MSATDALVASAKTAALGQASEIVAKGKTEFLAAFGSFVKPEDVVRIGLLFDRALVAKASAFTAATGAEAKDFSEQYEAHMDDIETIGDAYLIVGKAKAGAFVRSMAHQVIAGAFAVAGAVLQAGLGIVLPGAGSLLGAGLNAGLQHVVAYFLSPAEGA